MSDAFPPCVLIISGNDPSGGAGIAADLQAVSALGAHPAPVITSLTVQDTVNAWRVDPVDPGLVADQARAVLADLPVAAIKIGLLADAGIGTAVAEVIEEHPGPRVVLDPVLVAAGGAELAERDIERVMMDRLFPLATLVTPNALELRRLGGEDGDRASRARRLLDAGARWVLAKGADEDTPGARSPRPSAHIWPRVPRCSEPSRRDRSTPTSACCRRTARAGVSSSPGGCTRRGTQATHEAGTARRALRHH
jgi:hydroxymethylpyrimidine/phosphomethylpyrimidine kinase